MYTYKDNLCTFLGSQDFSIIENESNTDYENRVVYVCKDLCQDYIKTDLYKADRKNISLIKVILTNPWCIYETMNLEKKLDKPEKIDQRLIERLIVHKDHDDVSILKNSIFNINLNGYNVTNINQQIAEEIHIQYLSVYSSTNFLNRLRNTLETIFHTHDIDIDSIYSYINENDNIKSNIDNQLKIIIEDKGVDVSYVYQKKNITNLFIPYGYLDIRDKIKASVHMDDDLLDKTLKSKSFNLASNNTSAVYDKNLNSIWLDLESSVKTKIEEELNQGLDVVKFRIREFIDSIEREFIQKGTIINIYNLDQNMLFSVGFNLAYSIRNDAYILGKLLTDESNIFTKKIF
jgi:hypothetical protein